MVWPVKNPASQAGTTRRMVIESGRSRAFFVHQCGTKLQSSLAVMQDIAGGPSMTDRFVSRPGASLGRSWVRSLQLAGVNWSALSAQR